jgi:peroxiredoxin
MMKFACRHLAPVMILVLAALVTAMEPGSFKPSHCVAQTPDPESGAGIAARIAAYAQKPRDPAGTLILGPKTALCFIDFQCDSSEQFLDVISALTRRHMTSVKWVTVTSENPDKLEAALEARNALAEVVHDRQGRLLDKFGIVEVPAVILTSEGQVIYRSEKYVPLHNERLIEIVSCFARGQEIPEAYADGRLKVGEGAPDITLPDVSGKTWSLKLYKKTKKAHSRLLYVFTIMNCEPCREALKFLKENAHNLDDTEVVVISFGPKKLTMRELERMPLPFIVLCDENSETYAGYHLSDTPTIVLTCDDIVTHISSGWDSNKQQELLQVITDPQ